MSPIFFIGVPRSGTTILFEAFSRHPDLAWPSNYSERFPTLPCLEVLRPLLDNKYWNIIGHKGQYGSHRFGNRYLPHSAEAYSFWNTHAGTNLGRRYLDDQSPDEATIRRLRKAAGDLVRWQRRHRFSAKFTGPPRISFLSTVFPDAVFVHVVRDGRAVVHSLLRVRFWREKGGLEGPYWKGKIPDALLDEWERSHRDPGVLAGIQWRHIVQRCRDEARDLEDGRYLEVKYEEFAEAPEATIRDALEFCGMSYSSRVEQYLETSERVVNMNHKFVQDFKPEYIDLLTRAMQPALRDYGYV